MQSRRNPETRRSLIEQNQYEASLDDASFCTATVVIISVLFVTGVLALLISFIGLFVAETMGETTTEASLITTTEIPTTDLDHITKRDIIETTTNIGHPTSDPSKSCEKRVVGFYTEIESSPITKTQLRKLTHAVFAYIQMNSDGTLQFKTDRIRQRFLDMKNKAKSIMSDSNETDLKIMVSIGGPDNSDNYSNVLEDPAKKRTFIESVMSLLKEHDIDGVDLFWKWPKEYQQFEYSKLLKELRKRMSANQLISINAPPAGINNWEYGFDLNGILKHVDFINVLSMDYYGPWPNQWGTPAGPTSPLYGGINEKENFNVDHTMRYYSCETQNPSKLNLIIPFYARLWRNVQGALDVGAEVFRHVELKNEKAQGRDYMSRWTADHEKWKLVNATWDEDTKTAYIFDPNAKTYLTFETEKSIAAKMEYVKAKKLGGVWLWNVDQDDKRNSVLNAVTSNKQCLERDDGSVEYDC
ncbi:unnamed protein product [Caenorhabditis nigoni]